MQDFELALLAEKERKWSLVLILRLRLHHFRVQRFPCLYVALL